MRKSLFIAAVLVALLPACESPGQKGSVSKADPELLWTYEGLGRGYGAPCITDDGIFINAEEEGNSYTVCLKPDGTDYPDFRVS